MMTLNQGFRQMQKSKPNLDYPYLGIPDVEEKTINYDTEEISVLGSRKW